MDPRAALLVLAIRAPLTYFLIWRLLTKSNQHNSKGKKYFLKVLKRSLMGKMMEKVWQLSPQNNEMRVRVLCVCRDGATNRNPCLLYWYRFLHQEQFFVGSLGRQIQNMGSNFNRRLLEELPEGSAENCWKKADYAYNIGSIDYAIILFARARRF
jgi:hypothetical protein